MSDMDICRKYCLEELTERLRSVLEYKHRYSDPNGPVYQSLRKLLGKCYLRQELFLEAAHSFVEALGPSARTMATYRTERKLYDGDPKSKMELLSRQMEKILSATSESLESNSDPLLDYLAKSNAKYGKQSTGCNKLKSDIQVKQDHLEREYVMHKLTDDHQQVAETMNMLNQLPEEWTVIQLTASYEPCEMWQNQKFIRSAVKDFNMTVLKSDAVPWSRAPPFSVTITPDKVKYGERPVFEELHACLEENLRVIETRVSNNNESIKKYWDKRADCDQNMKGVVSTMDVKWLGGWRCLLPGNILDVRLVNTLRSAIKNACQENRIILTPIQKMLIYNLASFVHGVTLGEISLMLRKIFIEYSVTPNVSSSDVACKTCKDTRKINDLCVGCEQVSIAAGDGFQVFRKAFGNLLNKIKSQEILKDLKNTKRGPVILFVDEKLDIFPWEVLPSLSGQPVTRMEGLHFTYALYKAQERHIQGGYYQLRPNKGSYLINPGGDLDRMEKRMSAFIDYWCPEWEGDRNSQPPPETFQKYLQDSDIFLYCGHNDGSQYMYGGVERLERARAVSTLSGCGSVRLRPPGTRLLPLPVHTHYHIATCPCVVGMLWEVTDLEVDKVTSMLLGVFLPPLRKQKPHWGDVSKAKWTQGKIDPPNVESDSKFRWEPDLLRAVAISRRSTSYVMIAASVVARGIPIRIHPDHQINIHFNK